MTKKTTKKTATGKVEKTKKKAEPALKQPKMPSKDVAYNPWDVLKHLSMTEKSMGMVEVNNTLVFIVSKKAEKDEVKEAVERGFDVKVASVNVVRDMKGGKKAYVKLQPDFQAIDVASKLGML